MSELKFLEDGSIEFDARETVVRQDDVELVPPENVNLFDELLQRRRPFVLASGSGSSKVEVDFHPVDLKPAPADPAATLSLAGAWEVMKQPFPSDESKLVSANPPKSGWSLQDVPGPTFMGSPDSGPGKDNIKWSHVKPDEGAVLTRTVEAPKDFPGEVLRLRFDGVYPRGDVYLDGTPLGTIETGLTPVEFDVTDLVKKGSTHRVTVRLYRTGKYVRLDMPRWSLEFAGIHRPVTLVGLPAVHVDSLRLVADYNPRTGKGTLGGSMRLENASKKSATVKAAFTLAPCCGKAKSLGAADKVTLEPGQRKDVEFSFEAGKVDPWSAEFPNLYDLAVDLKAGSKTVESIERRIGFRRFELTPKGPKLNGAPVKVRGVNFMTYDPLTGLAMTREDIRKDLELMKRANFNGVRTHFSGPSALAELCDEMGLYFIQELPIDWSPDLMKQPGYLGGIMLRLQGALQRDRNNPSILAWALGNENLIHDEAEREIFLRHAFMLKNFVKKLDPSRPIMFPPPGPAGAFRGQMEVVVGDIGDIHYSFKPVREFNETGKLSYYTSWERNEETKTRKELIEAGWSGVWFSSECLIFNSNPDLHEAGYLSIIDDQRSYQDNPQDEHDQITQFRRRLRTEWGYMEQDPTCLGMAFFNWRDPASGENWKWIRYGERNTWGLVDPHRNLKPVFWAARTILAPVRVQREVVAPRPTRKPRVKLTNLYNFTNLNQCDTYVQVCRGQARYKGTTPATYQKLKLELKPGKSKSFAIDLGGMAEDFKRGERLILRFTFCDPRGYRIVTRDCLLIPGWTGEIVAEARDREFCLMGEV